MNLPTTEPARRIATLFGRRLTTVWTPKEIKQFKLLYKSGCFKDESEWLMIERYYKHERARGGYHRRDIATFLNHYPGELDRARAYCESHPIRSKVVKFYVVRTQIDDSPEAVEQRRKVRAQCKEELKRSLGSGTSAV